MFSPHSKELRSHGPHTRLGASLGHGRALEVKPGRRAWPAMTASGASPSCGRCISRMWRHWARAPSWWREEAARRESSFSKSHNYSTKGDFNHPTSAFPMQLLEKPQLTTAFAKATTQPNRAIGKLFACDPLVLH